ncbi:MAG TPA: alpha/beta hydrolase [Candidatus Nanopelagicales bacterium]
MSTPPFIAIPDGVALCAPGACPVPVLLAEPATPVTGVTNAHDVLLVPGFTGSKEDYIAVLAPLAARGWRVAAMDLPGQGAAPPLGPRGSNLPEDLAGAVVEVARWLAPGRPVHLVGHSMGGLVTRAVVLAHPELVASWTIVCSGPGPVPVDRFETLTMLQHLLASQPMAEVWVIKEALDRAGGWSPPSPEVAEFCAQRFIANDPAALHDAAETLMTAPDLTDEAARVLARHRIPAAVVTGALDDAWPIAEQASMAERLGCPWYELPGVGHNPSTEDPVATVELLDAIFTGAPAGTVAEAAAAPGRRTPASPAPGPDATTITDVAQV